MTTDPTSPVPPEVVLRRQQLTATTRRVTIERLRVRRVVVTETRQVEVTVRREQLEIERLPLPGPDPALPGSAVHDPSAEAGEGTERVPLVVVLREEVPVVQLRTRPYERVTVRVESVAGEQELTADVQSERAEVDEGA